MDDAKTAKDYLAVSVAFRGAFTYIAAFASQLFKKDAFAAP